MHIRNVAIAGDALHYLPTVPPRPVKVHMLGMPTTRTDLPATRPRAPLALVLPAVLLCVLLWPRLSAADTITLAWDANSEPEVTGYFMYVGTQSGVYTQTIDVQNTTTYAFTSAVPGQRYYFAVAAYAGSAVSALSNEVSGISNSYPVLTDPGNRTGRVGQAESLLLAGSDPDGAAVTYSATGLPPGLSLTTATGLIAGTPTTVGTYNVTVTVSDGVLSASRSFSWTIAAANVAPTLAVVANRSGTVGQATSLQLQGSDANGNTLTYSASGLPTGLSVTAATGLIAGTPTAAGTFNVTATVSDGTLTASRSFSWTIAAANVAPTLAVVANQSGTMGQATSLQLQGSDANGNTLTYSASGLPTGLSVTAATGLIAGTPTAAGTFNVTATVSDGTLTASRSFSWTIAAANVAPTLAVVANQSGTMGQATSLQLQGSDANGNTLTYSASGLPTGLSVTAATGLIAGTPTAAGTFNVTATVSDGTLTASRSFSWTIAAANVAPTLAVVANQSGTMGQATSLQLQGSDANGNTLTYSASGLPTGLSVTAATGLIAGTPTAAGTFNVTATVSDGTLTASRSFSWTIAAANVAPTLVSVADPSGTLGQATSLQLQGSDANGNPLTYSASGLPPGLSVAANTGLIAGTPTTAGTFIVTATVSDGALSASRSFSWTIAALTETRAAARRSSPGTGTPSSTSTSSLAYTGTTAVVRSVASPPSDEASTLTGTSAVLRTSGTGAAGVTGATATSSGSTTRAVISNPLTGSIQAVSGSPPEGDAASIVTSTSAPGTPPTIGIETPVEGAVLAADSPVIFAGIARDAEDGDLGNRIVWVSSRDGQIGAGSLLHKPLTAGTHTITASVTDSGGNTRSAQVTIRVGP